MTMLLTIAAILAMSVGVAFLFAAALGVLRFADALQRMHAATKAGTIGAVFVLAGTVMVQSSPDSTFVGLLAIAFLLMTVPVAAHLLGRATYVSGAYLQGIVGKDALLGKLARRTAPLERRTEFLPFTAPEPIGSSSRSEDSSLSGTWPEPTDVRFAVIAPDIDAVVARSLEIARKWQVPLNALAIIDERFIAASRSPNITRPMVREAVATAVARLHEILPIGLDNFSLTYEEGDPLALIPDQEQESSLLVLPPRGWCHHGVEVLTPLATGRPEGLLRLAGLHRGPILYVGDSPPPKTGSRVAVLDDGSSHLLSVLAWALRGGLWEGAMVHLIGKPTGERLRRIEDALEGIEGIVLHVVSADSPGSPLLPPEAADFDALVTPILPQPMRTDWYGMFWHEQIVEDWHGEVFLVPNRPRGL